MDSEGELQVVAYITTAKEPLPNADVIVTSNGENGEREIIATLVTDETGRTRVITVAAPSKENSLVPDNGNLPYATYNITVQHPDYYTVDVKNAQVFPGELSLQPTVLIPVLQDRNPAERVDTVEVTPQNL